VTLRRAWLLAACLLYLLLAAHQLGLPGLHYDEAREAGVNAMELLTGAPVTAFRGAGFVIGARAFPLMVQDYIGALNVYLALPLLGLTGIGVPNLRLLPLLTGLAALLTLERALAAWIVYRRGGFRTEGAAALPTPPITVAGLIAVTMLAVSPSFIFWARQGVFVTNLMLPLTFVAAWQALRWLHTGRTRHLMLAAIAAGLALYAKLLAIWAIAPLLVLVGGWWLWRPHPGPSLGGEGDAPSLPPGWGRLGGGARARSLRPVPPGADPAYPLQRADRGHAGCAGGQRTAELLWRRQRQPGRQPAGALGPGAATAARGAVLVSRRAAGKPVGAVAGAAAAAGRLAARLAAVAGAAAADAGRVCRQPLYDQRPVCDPLRPLAAAAGDAGRAWAPPRGWKRRRCAPAWRDAASAR
jgi:hypothetical protein